MRPDSPAKERNALAKVMTYRNTARWLVAVLSGISLVGCQQQMGIQPYYQPLEENPLFEDKRAVRPLEPGTVSRGDLRENDALYTGKVDGKLVEAFPMEITQEIIDRGENRFNIYCAPCHSKLGDGNGMIVQRGVYRPPSFTDDRLVTAPVGHIYDVITNGFGRMYSYNQQIPVRDRWAIVAYVKTLQVAGRGTVADVPEAERERLMNMEPVTTAPMTQNPTVTAHAGASAPHTTGGAQ